MKGVCIKVGDYHLTVGKIYELLPLKEEFKGANKLFNYMVVNDIGYQHLVEGDLFKPIHIIREEKLKELGI